VRITTIDDHSALGKQTPAEYAAKCEVSAAQRLVQRMEMTGNTRKAASIMIAEI
jgi:hypothetical protein